MQGLFSGNKNVEHYFFSEYGTFLFVVNFVGYSVICEEITKNWYRGIRLIYLNRKKMSQQNSQSKSAISLIPSFTPIIPESLCEQANNSDLVEVNDGMREISLFGTFALTILLCHFFTGQLERIPRYQFFYMKKLLTFLSAENKLCNKNKNSIYILLIS